MKNDGDFWFWLGCFWTVISSSAANTTISYNHLMENRARLVEVNEKLSRLSAQIEKTAEANWRKTQEVREALGR